MHVDIIILYVDKIFFCFLKVDIFFFYVNIIWHLSEEKCHNKEKTYDTLIEQKIEILELNLIF